MDRFWQLVGPATDYRFILLHLLLHLLWFTQWRIRKGPSRLRSLPLLWETDWRRHSRYSMWQWYYCIMATPSPVYLFKHVL